MTLYKKYSKGCRLNNSATVSREGLSLPSSPGLSDKEILEICETIRKIKRLNDLKKFQSPFDMAVTKTGGKRV
jgi:dTDP-4-amino-4,6-dideoxygalactose transaminase